MMSSCGHIDDGLIIVNHFGKPVFRGVGDDRSVNDKTSMINGKPG